MLNWDLVKRLAKEKNKSRSRYPPQRNPTSKPPAPPPPHPHPYSLTDYAPSSSTKQKVEENIGNNNITYKSCYYSFILLPSKGLYFSHVGISN